MTTINKASLFDDEIAQTAKALEELATANAPFAELEACRVKLSILIDRKRELLFSPPDPAYYIDEFLRSAPIEARRVKAGELAELALGAINDIQESEEPYDPLDLETYLALHEFFEYFSRPNGLRPGSPDEDFPEAQEVAAYAGPIVRTFDDLSELSKYIILGALNALVKRGFLSDQNRRRLKYRLQKLPKLVDGSPIVWNRDAESLATMVIVADWLKEVEFDKRLQRKSEDRAIAELGSMYYSFLTNGFDARVGGNSKSRYYQALTRVEVDFRNFLKKVQELRLKRKHGLQVEADSAQIIRYYFQSLSNFPEEQAKIRQNLDSLDFEVLEAYAESISDTLDKE